MYVNISTDELIPSDSIHYEVQKLLGRGTYGIVTKCRKTTTNEVVALKILRTPLCMEAAKKEVAFFKSLRNFNLDNFNIIKLNTYFTFKGQLFLEFEKLDMNLKQLIQKNSNQTLEMTAIRSIVQQMATALEFLKGIGVVHADLKPKNIMVVDHLQKPVRVKVIDFGLACNHPEKHVGVQLQSRYYRAPEVMLGSPFNEAIDVWSLGCVAAELLLGKVLFQGCDEYDMMRWIVFTVGQPPLHVLDAGLYTEEFFKKTSLQPGNNHWILGSRHDERISAGMGNMLSDLQTILQKAPYRVSEKDTICEICERVSFVDVVTKMLTVDAAERITPTQILQHPFVTMDHLVDIFGCTPSVQSLIEQRNTFQSLSSDNEEDVRFPPTYQSEDSSYITASSRVSDSSEEGSSVWLSANEHFSPSDSIIRKENSSDKKEDRKDTDADSLDKTPDPFQVKKRKRGCQNEVPAETRGQMRADKSKGRKRTSNTTPENNCPGRKGRRINKAKSVTVNTQLWNGVKKTLRRSERIKCRLIDDDPVKRRKKEDGRERRRCCTY